MLKSFYLFHSLQVMFETFECEWKTLKKATLGLECAASLQAWKSSDEIATSRSGFQVPQSHKMAKALWSASQCQARTRGTGKMMRDGMMGLFFSKMFFVDVSSSCCSTSEIIHLSLGDGIFLRSQQRISSSCLRDLTKRNPGTLRCIALEVVGSLVCLWVAISV